MKITIFKTDSSCEQLGEFKSAHITMFDGRMNIKIHFFDVGEQLNFVKCCINNYVLIQIQGNDVTLIPENANFQRVRFRFD